jgi:hypothetical protein
MIVYAHRRLDTNKIFYIGIGLNKKRAYVKSNRSKFWNNIINKTSYIVEIIATDLSKKSACELEVFFILLYGRQDLELGELVNMTDGGEGISNPSIKTRKLLSDIKKEQKIIPPSQKGTKRSQETINKHKNTLQLNGVYNQRKVICTITNKIWVSAKDCAESNNLKKQTLVNKLNGHRKNQTSFEYFR